jgi:hypothetical protein
MRLLTPLEYQELSALAADVRERNYHGPTLDDLEATNRIERFDEDEDSYRLRVTDLGALTIRLYPMLQGAGS